MMNDFAKVLSSTWLIDPAHLRPLMERVAAASPEAVAAAVQAYRDPQPKMIGDIAVIECNGPITGRNSWFSMWYGSSTIESMQAQFRLALADPNVKTIVFRADTPGGTIDLAPEFADELYAARELKNIIVVADTCIASLGTWLFSQCSTIYVPRSGQIGSCGAYLLHQDISKMLENWGIKMTFIYAGEHKVEGNMFEPLSDDAKTHFQDEINQVKGWFDAALARARGVSVKHVLENFGQGRMFYGQAAVKAGLADKVATFDAVIGRLQGRKRTGVPVATASAVQATGDHINEGDGGPTMMADDVARNATTPSADVPASAAVEPDVDGQCPEGYELRDGQCHRRNDDDEDARAAAERDAVNIAIALSE